MNTIAPTRRVVLLGASNLVRGFPTIVETVRRTWREPIEIMVAMGHGRSYGQDSAVLGRKIPGIFPCALWRDLQIRAPLPTTALITDIGNDFLYGVTPDRLLAWVEECLDRLGEAGALASVTQLPIGSLESLGERRFQLFRRMLFPRSNLTLAEALQHARATNERLTLVGSVRKVPVISVSPKWYGLDPIHIKRRVQRIAWPELLSGWRATSEPFTPVHAGMLMTAYLAVVAPAEYSRFGFSRRAAQPTAQFFDGTTISLY
ncbi:MAG TPA: hypothetical protein VH107_12770 [Lacipirellulaceae bacterium]|nr:hypothetical protein [Lacipirellulaceae bacterium]